MAKFGAGQGLDVAEMWCMLHKTALKWKAVSAHRLFSSAIQSLQFFANSSASDRLSAIATALPTLSCEQLKLKLHELAASPDTIDIKGSAFQQLVAKLEHELADATPDELILVKLSLHRLGIKSKLLKNHLRHSDAARAIADINAAVQTGIVFCVFSAC